MPMRVLNFATSLGVILLQFSQIAGYSAGKKLIEFGWDEPDPAFMREHIAEMEKTPLDGCVFHANFTEANGGTGNFTWQSWGERAFSEAQLKAAIDDLK